MEAYWVPGGQGVIGLLQPDLKLYIWKTLICHLARWSFLCINGPLHWSSIFHHPRCWISLGTTFVWEAIVSGEATGSLNCDHHRSMGGWLDSVCLLMPAASTVLTHQETWNLSKNLHDRIFRPNILHTKLWLFLLKMKERKCKILQIDEYFMEILFYLIPRC